MPHSAVTLLIRQIDLAIGKISLVKSCYPVDGSGLREMLREVFFLSKQVLIVWEIGQICCVGAFSKCGKITYIV